MDEIEPITYAPATAAMRPLVTDLLRACGLPVEDVSPTLDHFFVARAGSHLVACVGIDMLGEVALLRSLAVDLPWRGRGTARRLFEHAQHRAQQLGAQELFLLTTTAEAIFARWGFQRLPRDSTPTVVQATPEYRTLCPGSAVVMHLPVASADRRTSPRP
jgi:amino-acid N-acetyltransferase